MLLREVFENRRAVNFFDKSTDLSTEQLQEIIDLAVLAPSAFNLQPWRIIAVKSQEGKEKLFAQAQQPKIKEAPVSLIIIGDRGGFKDGNPMWGILEEGMGAERVNEAKKMASYLYGSTSERSVKFAESNAGLLAMSVMYAAKSFGVDSHPMSGVDFQGIKESFNLAEEEDVVMVIALGYHDQEKKLYPRGYRRGFNEIVELV